MELVTLADVRALVEKHLPAEYRSKFTWRQLAGSSAPLKASRTWPRCRLRERAADRRHQMLVEGRRFPTALTVVLILAVIFVLIVLLWPLGRLPWP
jgi:hypothetical protein